MEDFLAGVAASDFSCAIRALDVLIREASGEEAGALLLNRGRCYQRLELNRKALKDLNEAVRLCPADVHALLALGQVLLCLDRVDHARAAFQAGVDASTALTDIGVLHQLYQSLAAVAAGNKRDMAVASRSGHPFGAAAPPQAVPPASAPAAGAPPPAVAPSPPPPSASASAPPPHAPRRQPEAMAQGMDKVAAPATSKVAAAAPLTRPSASDMTIAINSAVTMINSGKLEEAESVLDSVLDASPPRDHTALGAHVARGTARALRRRLPEAVEDFSAAIELDPTFADGWKRRGQARSAMGNSEEALSDLMRCLQLTGAEQEKAEIYLERGMIFQKQRDYRRATAELRQATRLCPSMHQAWNILGLCSTSQGDIQEGVAAYEEALRLNPKLREAWMNMGQVLKEYGSVAKAEEAFRKGTSLDERSPLNAQGFRMIAAMRQGCGDHAAAVDLLDRALAGGDAEQRVECLFLRGACQHALGYHERAVADYDAALTANQSNGKEVRTEQFLAFYQKEIALYLFHRLDRNVRSFCVDRELPPLFKEAWCKKLPPSAELVSSYRGQPPLRGPAGAAKRPRGPPPAEVAALVGAADPLGRLIQYRHQGFLPNARQLRAAGLAALELAQTVSRAVFDRAEGRPTWVDSEGASCSGCSGRHEFGWRDAMDIVVKWRQLSEPNDQVLWVDLLTRKEFEAGFGSHTPMYSGQTKCVRYYMNFRRALELHKEVLLEAGAANDAGNAPIALGSAAKRAAIQAASDAGEMWATIGADSWIVVPIASVAKPDRRLEGTRLTLVAMQAQPDGYEFSIRTPVTPPRWAEFDAELEAAWDNLLDAMVDGDVPRASGAILRFAYYWYNFMPLARGTAAVGYITILGLFLAAGAPVAVRCPEGVQVDWEAILSRSPRAFTESVLKWMKPGEATPQQAKSLPDLEQLPKVSETLATMRARLNALNGPKAEPV